MATIISQFTLMTDHGTRIIIYNLWEDDEGRLELDFEADKHVCFMTQAFLVLFLDISLNLPEFCPWIKILAT